MSEVIRQIQRILSTKAIVPIVESELIVTLADRGSWRFRYSPSLVVERIDSARVETLKVCKIYLSEELFIKVLKGEISQQDAHNDGSLIAQGEVKQLIEANYIIDSLREASAAFL